MLTKKAQGILSGGSIGVAVILIVFLVFILIYLVAIPEQYKEELNITSPVQYSSVVLNEYPGKLYLGNGDVKTETYNYDISTVSLDNTPQKESILLSPQGFIKKSTTSTRILTYDFDVNDINELDRVYLNFGKPNQREIKEMRVEEAKRFFNEGHFPPGSMGPKVESAIYFLEKGGKEVIITSISQVWDALHGRGRFTRIVP